MSNSVLEAPREEQLQGAELDLDMDALMAQILEDDTDRPAPANTVLVPGELLDAGLPEGELYGYIRPDTGRHTILAGGGNMPIPALKAERIGSVGTQPDWAYEYAIHGVMNAEGKPEFCLRTAAGEAIPLETVPYYQKQDVFSRHLGLIETDWMDDSCAVLCGCGSVGSCIALQMARSGVGRFVLIDADAVEIHNMCRHQCNHTDIGRFKVDAVADRILQINPNAQILKLYRFIQDVPVHKYADWIDPKNTVFIGTCDNRLGNATASDIAYSFGAPFLALGYLERAWGGEIFIGIPERKDICYHCAFKTQVERSRMELNRNHLYMNSDNAGKVTFVPGLDVDIEYGCAIASKLLLDIFNRNNPKYSPRMLHTVGQYMMFSGTGDRRNVPAVWQKILPQPLSMRQLRLDEACRRCSYCLPEA